ncbi:hypothetical protein EUGRSUZ_C02076 [Eucalyptus grandis]|uniref:Uncharacterized protein n=2 Tax=Eucalyptus grandis TaxID=71139 RepID=A0ACC3LEQ9_EUCGR|nr:hypothetical protein EUGRSUZ_C02076 [Eucalyptus grandis]
MTDVFTTCNKQLHNTRSRNDKATILTDTIQVLKDLTAEVNKLKAECTALIEESRELMQEKNELTEEKSSLKSEVENLNVQYQQRMRVMYPWAAMDPSVVMGPAYSYPVPIPVTPGPIPMHSQLQPFPFFGNQNASAIPAPCSTFIPNSMPANPTFEQQSTQYASSSHVSNKKDSKSRSSDHQRGSIAEQDEDSNGMATDLELKMPGTSSQQDLTSGEKKGKQTQRKEISILLMGARQASFPHLRLFQIVPPIVLVTTQSPVDEEPNSFSSPFVVCTLVNRGWSVVYYVAFA